MLKHRPKWCTISTLNSCTLKRNESSTIITSALYLLHDGRRVFVQSIVMKTCNIFSKAIPPSMHLLLWMNVMHDFICKSKGIGA